MYLALAAVFKEESIYIREWAMKLFCKTNQIRRTQTLGRGRNIEVIEVEVGKHRMSLANSGHFVRKQADTILTRQSVALLWMQLMGPGDLIDVGANIGIISLLAAKSGRSVLSIEPGALNFAELTTNIALNNLGHCINAINVAANDRQEIVRMGLSNMDPGRAGISIHSDPKMGYHYCSSTTVDHMAEAIPGDYRHLKIDVDGLEDVVLRGSSKTLEVVDSVLLECNYSMPSNIRAASIMRGSGWICSELQKRFTCHGIISSEQVSSRARSGEGIVDLIWYKRQDQLDHLDDLLSKYTKLTGMTF